MNCSGHVNVFYGSGNIDLPSPEGIAATWYFIKAQCGNTFPHAALPFGKMTCGAYSGGYTSGYGVNVPNSCGRDIPAFKEKHTVRGLSHLHQSGTGAIGMYYNFAVTSPMYGGLRPIEEEAVSEEGRPGYYAVTFGDSGIRAEATVWGSTAFHRYTMKGEGTVSVDFSNDGLDRSFGEQYYGLAENAEVICLSENELYAGVTMHGVSMYFYVVCPESVGSFLWRDYERVDGGCLKEDRTEKRFGGGFRVNGDCNIRVTLSLIGLDHAKALALRDGADFNRARELAADKWEKYLSAIEIDGDDSTKELFYSNLYHSLIKPWDFSGESFLYSGGEFMCDFGTMWDMYKTQLPLVFTLYREESEKILETFKNLGREYDRLPVNLTLTTSMDLEEQQARMLMEHSVADGYFRGISADYRSLLEIARRDLETSPEFSSGGRAERWTHHLDMSEGCGAMAELALCLGEDPEPFLSLSESRRQAFDRETGLLRSDSVYYEGDLWNYSFRLMRDMKERIALAGGEEKFLSLLDSFFGYGADPVTQPEEHNCWEFIDARPFHRFEGFNNEPDMETPYAYIFAGRPDRTQEILRAGMRYMFTLGRGGLPGNNDSGGLSSCFVWNALGIFPVSGQDRILFGSPVIKSAVLHLSSGNELRISVDGYGKDRIYVRRVLFNGAEINDLMLTARELMSGGELVFEMK